MTRPSSLNQFLVLGATAVGAYLVYQAVRPRYSFRGKHVVITGGSRGLGLLMARQLAAEGARLSICSRTVAELNTAADDLRGRGAAVAAFSCDITDPADARNFVEAARRRNGPVDVLINNAGMIGVGPEEEMRPADYDVSLKTHFWAAYYMVEAVLPEMKARKSGRIVNVSSFAGKVAVPHMLPYTVGKHALTGYSNGLRAELAEDGIVVTTVIPGVLRTGSHVNAEFKGRNDEEYAWFAAGAGVPGFSMSGEGAARAVLLAAAHGEAEVVLTLPAKLAVAAQTLFPGLLSGVSALVNRHVLPSPGGIGARSVKGHDSRGLLPAAVTALPDAASGRNNETRAAKMAGDRG